MTVEESLQISREDRDSWQKSVPVAYVLFCTKDERDQVGCLLWRRSSRWCSPWRRSPPLPVPSSQSCSFWGPIAVPPCPPPSSISSVSQHILFYVQQVIPELGARAARRLLQSASGELSRHPQMGAKVPLLIVKISSDLIPTLPSHTRWVHLHTNDQHETSSWTLPWRLFVQSQTISLEQPPLSPQELSPEPFYFTCGRCRRAVFTSDELLLEPLHDPHCQSWFLDERAALRLNDPSHSSKLRCPGCEARLGSLQWSGARCGCSQWMAPCVAVPKAKVDRRSSRMLQRMR